jgi:hypothetical protein
MSLMKSIITFICCVCLMGSGLSVFGKTDRYRLIIRDNPATTICIGWDQVSGKNPEVFYGLKDENTNWKNYSDSCTATRLIRHKGMNNGFARLSDLQPNTAYYFVIRDNEGTSNRFWFKTAPDSPTEELSFITGGDSRTNRAPRQNANLIVSKLRPHAVIFAGDFCHHGNDTEWKNWLDDWQKTIGVDGRITPIIPARGNHEKSNRDLVHLFDVPCSSVYYSISFNSLFKVITLNTEISKQGPQTWWLKKELKKSGDMTWVVPQYHRPARPHISRKPEGKIQYKSWIPQFMEYGVRFAIESDSHTHKVTWPISPSDAEGNDEGFVRDDKNGIVYVGEGCWGAPLQVNDDDKSWTRDSGRLNQIKWVFVNQKRIEVRTVQTRNAASVEMVKDSDRFTPPANLGIHTMKDGEQVVKIVK